MPLMFETLDQDESDPLHHWSWEIMQICPDYTRARLQVDVQLQDYCCSESDVDCDDTRSATGPLPHFYHGFTPSDPHCDCGSHLLIMRRHILKDCLVKYRQSGITQTVISSTWGSDVVVPFAQLCVKWWACGSGFSAERENTRWTSCNRRINTCCIMDRDSDHLIFCPEPDALLITLVWHNTDPNAAELWGWMLGRPSLHPICCLQDDSYNDQPKTTDRWSEQSFWIIKMNFTWRVEVKMKNC